MIFRVSFLNAIIFCSIMICLTGCGIYKSGNPSYKQVPESNITVAEKAIEQAFVNSGIPAVNDTANFGLYISRDKNGMVATIGAEYLFSKGWKLNVKQSELPNLSISLDTVSVRITAIKSGKVKTVSRRSEARISIEVNTSAGTKQVYSGMGFYEDNPPVNWVKSNRSSEDFVSYSSGFGNISSVLMPLLYSVTGTTIIWLFYSYRN